MGLNMFFENRRNEPKHQQNIRGSIHKENDMQNESAQIDKTAELPHGGIVMYCTAWCPDCRRARLWLKAHDFSYTEVDVEKNSAASAQVRGWNHGNLVTPTFDIDGTIVPNFNEATLTRILQPRLKIE
jgi:glutaredoxin